ncbi:MAG: hypothetical protein JO026_03335 [Patescibacteria group bacterium]|nr:hypothetical protein [Patescibacteria group bacterium]
MLKKIISLVVALGVSALAASAYASTISVGGQTGVSANTSLGSQANVSGSATANVQTGTGASSSVASATDANTGVNANVGSDNTILHTDVANDASIPLLSSVSSADVSSDAALATYAKAVVKSDDNVGSVATGPDHVAVTYKQRAWLFGFIPTTVNTEADVTSDGKVSVHYPWYAFLMKTTKSSLENRIHASLSADMGANANASGSFNARTEAMLVSSLRSAFKANLDADTNASAAASTNASAATNATVHSTGNVTGAVNSNANSNSSVHANVPKARATGSASATGNVSSY